MYELLAPPTVVGPAVVIMVLAIIYRAPRGLSLLLAVIVAIFTKDRDRRNACLTIVDAMCEARSRRSRSRVRLTPPRTGPRDDDSGKPPLSLSKP